MSRQMDLKTAAFLPAVGRQCGPRLARRAGPPAPPRGRPNFSPPPTKNRTAGSRNSSHGEPSLVSLPHGEKPGPYQFSILRRGSDLC